MEAGRVSQKRRFPKAMLLENSQVNLQHGRCKLTKRRCCVEQAASVPRFACEVERQRAVEQCTSVYTFSRHTSVYVGKRQVLCTKLASD